MFFYVNEDRIGLPKIRVMIESIYPLKSLLANKCIICVHIKDDVILMAIVSDSLIPVGQGIHSLIIHHNRHFIFEIRQSAINVIAHDRRSVVIWDIIDVDELIIGVVLSFQWVKKSGEFVVLSKVSAWCHYAYWQFILKRPNFIFFIVIIVLSF